MASDDRLDHLFKTYGVVWEYVDDYGMGTIRIAAISENGKLI